MSLDQVLKASLPPTVETSRPVAPTLMVGLGGTGKEVLLRLRRKIVEHYGSLSRLPFIQFMHLDTDTTTAAQEQYDLLGSDDPLQQEVRFKPIERIDLTIDGGTGRYVQHIDSFPHIRRWFATGGKIGGLGNLAKGAGQVRMASRLGFYHAENFRQITLRLDQCKAQLRDASILQRSAELGFTFDAEQKINIVVVASLAGGTGSGTFLDMGFLLQKYFPSDDRIGILLLPSFFADYAGGERVRANGYAALMELNHYSFGHTFLADWDGTSRSESLLPPPFTNTYLIDGQNEANLVIGSAGKEYDAYTMVAEALFHDYSIGEFEGMKRATRINLANFNLSVYTHNFLNEALRKATRDGEKTVVGETYPTRFGSFGLSSISFPTTHVHAACACRLAAKIVDYWQNSVVDDPLEHLFTKFLTDVDVQGAQGRYERRDGGGVIERRDIEDALMVYDSGGGKTFASYLWQKAQTTRTEIEAAPNGEKAHRLAERRAELDQFLAHEDSDNPAEWGIGVRQLESNMRAYLQRLRNGIEAKAAAMSNEPAYGVNYTISLLKELKALLRNENFWYARHFEEQIPVWRDAVQQFGHELDALQNDIERHERQWLFRTEDLKRDAEKLVGDDGAEDLGAFYNHYLARVRKQVAKRGRIVCEELDRFLGADSPAGDGLLARYYNLLVGFETLKKRLQAKERYFSKPAASELTLSLYRDGDVDAWYRTWAGEQADEVETIKTVGGQLLEKIFEVGSVTAALTYIQNTPVEIGEARVLEHCRKWFADRAKQPEALALLNDPARFSVTQREELIRRAYRLAKVWVAPSERGLEHTGIPPVRTDQRPCLIGIDDSSPQRLNDFKAVISTKVQAPGDTPPSYASVGQRNRGTIVFYHELAGVPAFYPSSITAPRGLRAAYDAYADKEELHSDKNRFQFSELIPKNNEEARRYLDSLRAFVLGRVLGLMRARQLAGEGEHPVFLYSFRRVEGAIAEEVDLGSDVHAVDYLYRDKRAEHLTDRRYLLQKIESTLQTLRAQKRLDVYRLLLDFYFTTVYAPRLVEARGSNQHTFTQYSPEFAIIHQARERLDASFEPAELEQFKKSLVALSRKPFASELSYAEFAAVLAPYCTTAGKYAILTEDALVHRETMWRDVFALDLKRIDKRHAAEEAAPAPRPVSPDRKPESQFGERPCPKCASSIDTRAPFCTHCMQMVATLVQCPHCDEAGVPDDLELCWKCGSRMRTDEQIECPRCFAWKGYAEQFPCALCGFSLNDTAPVAGPVGPTTIPIAKDDDPPPTPPLADILPVAAAQVQCRICYSMVDPGPRCRVCSAALETA
jgi:hypothetical protein